MTERKFAKKIQASGHELKNTSAISILIFFCLAVFAFDSAYGHGVGSETFPPVPLNGKIVTLEVSSSNSNNDNIINNADNGSDVPAPANDQQISISLIDFESKITLRDVTFLIKSHRGEQFLFEKEFQADNGFLVFNFVSEEIDSVTVEEKKSDGNFFASLLGFESKLVDVKGPHLSEGGLYKFDVSILTADGYSKKLESPLTFDVGISIAQTSRYDIVDPNFGSQSIDVITYYDEISNFQYEPGSKEISFTMPFEWNASNINQTSVVHQEIKISKEFGDLLVSGFAVYVNGVQLSEDVVNIDDFFTDSRITHFIIYKKELFNVLESSPSQNRMDFLIKPDRDYIHLSSVTDNGQFRILVTLEPENIKSNSEAKVLFDITDIFLKNKPVATDYEFSITQGNNIIFKQSATSTDSADHRNVAEFFVPEDISGIIHLNFKNLDGNGLAKTSIPIVVDRIESAAHIPNWIKNSALWWSENQIDDETFIRGIEYLIQNQIIAISAISEDVKSPSIPSWVKTNAGWWALGQIDDETFIQGLKFLIQQGIIST